MKSLGKRPTLPTTFRRPRTFVSRLILAELLAKRGDGPLERKRLRYMPRRNR